MDKKIFLKTTKKGMAGSMVTSLIWAAIFLAAGLWLTGYIHSIYQHYHVASYAEFGRLSVLDREIDHAMVVDFGWAGAVIAYGLAALCFLFGFMHTLFYGSREVNALSINEQGYCSKIVCETYGFPYSKDTDQVVFDRIIDIRVCQSSVNRILNTGSLKLKMVTFTNADSKETEYTIPGIEGPYGRKEEIEKYLLGHEGLKVTLAATKGTDQ